MLAGYILLGTHIIRSITKDREAQKGIVRGRIHAVLLR